RADPLTDLALGDDDGHGVVRSDPDPGRQGKLSRLGRHRRRAGDGRRGRPGSGAEEEPAAGDRRAEEEDPPGHPFRGGVRGKKTCERAHERTSFALGPIDWSSGWIAEISGMGSPDSTSPHARKNGSVPSGPTW